MPQVDDMNFTELAMGPEIAAQQPNMPNKHGLYVEFYMEAVPDAPASLKAGHPKYKEVPYIMIMVPGDKAVVRRPVRTGQYPKSDNNRFHNEYVAFVQKKEMPVEGFPLEEWAQLTKSQVLELNHFGFKTVEHLAEVTDTNAQKFMGLFDLRDKAKAFIRTSKDAAPMQRLQDEIEHRNEQLLAMQNQMEEMSKELADLKTAK